MNKQKQIKELQQKIEQLSYFMERLEFNFLGEILAQQGGRTTGHSYDYKLWEQYRDEKEQAEKQLVKLQGD